MEGSDCAGSPVQNQMGESESEKQWRLYEAYNELHGLAQEFDTPFEAPAVLVVGHQTDGKSALVEALMGFQFNHVGGGTKTRRPITLHMKYDPLGELPRCRLLSDSPSVSDPTLASAEEKSLPQIQVFIKYLQLLNAMESFQFKWYLSKMKHPNTCVIFHRHTLKLKT